MNVAKAAVDDAPFENEPFEIIRNYKSYMYCAGDSQEDYFIFHIVYSCLNATILNKLKGLILLK